MIKNIIKWCTGSVPWWQFWNPQSGFIGGATASFLGAAIFYLYKLLSR